MKSNIKKYLVHSKGLLKGCFSLCDYEMHPAEVEFFFLAYWEVWNKGLVLGRQTLYHLSHASHPFMIFLVGSHIFAQGHPGSRSSHLAEISDMHHHAQFIGWDEVFFLGWPQTTIRPISASQVAGVVSMRHWTWPCSRSFWVGLEFELRA
jgi:hypothetical protein